MEREAGQEKPRCYEQRLQEILRRGLYSSPGYFFTVRVRLGGLLVETKSWVVVKRRRFTAEEYHKMAEAGILHEDDRVELIEGEIVDMAPIGSRHATCVRELVWLLSKQLSDELRLDVQNPVRLVEYGEPQTDLAVIRAGDYAGALPEPGDVLLLIEVSDTTLRYDPEVKLPLYAAQVSRRCGRWTSRVGRWSATLVPPKVATSAQNGRGGARRSLRKRCLHCSYGQTLCSANPRKRGTPA